MIKPGSTSPDQYRKLLAEKCAGLEKRFSSFSLSATSPPSIEIYSSPEENYHFRAEFSIWHDGDHIDYVMHDKMETNGVVAIKQFPVGSTLIQRLMPTLLQQMQSSEILRRTLFQVEFLTSLKGEALITLIYHKPLDEEWITQAKILRETLRHTLDIAGLHIVGRSRGQKIPVEQDFIHEIFTVDGKNYTYKQIEGSFTQPNAFVNQHMLDWVTAVNKNNGGDLLELYCGNANFTLPLSTCFNKILATEVSKTSIAAALYNITGNNITNIDLARLSSEETAQALARARPFRRLAHLDLDNYHISTVLVDPPRAGLDEQTLKLAQQFDRICYISCNPDTLIDNLRTLTQTHQIKRLAFFDQFPYTHHMECGVFLDRSRVA